MVLCIIALIVFAVLGIFSVKYRKLTAEAFDCVVRRVTLRPCVSKLDERIKAKVVGEAFKKSPGGAAFLNRHFEIFSWIFFILTLASFGYLVYGAYSLVTIGTCDPITGSCIFAKPNETITPAHCASTTFVEFYGAECVHCQRMEQTVKQVEGDTGVAFDKLEVWHNGSNYALMQEYAPYIEKDCGVMGTPTFLSTKTNRLVCGELSAASLKLFVMENG
jgi:hypothetical protein